MNPAHAGKAIRKLKKALNRFPGRPSIEEVHDLRSLARRFGTIVDALEVSEDRRNARVVKAVKSVRKAAGAVRDMDVLSQDARTLTKKAKASKSEEAPVIRLVQHLHRERTKRAKKLVAAVTRHRTSVRRGLKRLARDVKRKLKAAGAEDHATGAVTHLEEMSLMNILLELRLWPELDAQNLHPFRLKVKHLRDLLQLAGGVATQFYDDLGTTKNLIGEWHDWVELGAVADKTLTDREDTPTLRRIHAIEAQKLKAALGAAEKLLDRHVRFNPAGKAA